MHAPANTTTNDSPQSLLRIHRPRLLVVEDDSDVWRLIERAVRQANPEVAIHWATDAESARRALVNYHFDAVLADFMLEDSENGWWLLGECKRLQPNTHLALASSLPLSTPETEGVPFLQKPFGIEDCRAFVTRLIG